MCSLDITCIFSICEVKGMMVLAIYMCGAWNRLQALFLKDCPYAYYVYWFAHRLQLALVAAAGNEVSI